MSTSVNTVLNGAVGDEKSVRACVLKAARDLQIETRTLPGPRADELQIAVRSTGLCGSDLHYYKHFRNGDIIVREPMALGHESAGVVTAVGADVSGFAVGDKVALEVGLPCEECQRCSEGRYNLCKSMRFRSSAKAFPHFQGTLQQRINHPAKWCHKLPENVSLDLGALLEPLSVAIHAARRAGPLDGATVCVLGAGAVGALMAAVAKIKGARKVVITDIDAGRVDFAVHNAFAHAGHVIQLTKTDSLEDELQTAQETAAAIGRVDVGHGETVGDIDVVFECTGVTSSVRTGIYAARAGGKLMLIGMGTPIHLLPISAAALREVDILGVFRYAHTYPEGIEMVSRTDSAVHFSKLVTHRVRGLENAVRAFELAGSPKDEHGKLVMKVILDTAD